MSKERESRVYLKFFQENLLFLIIPLVLGSMGGYFFYGTKTSIYTASRLYQTSYNLENVTEKIQLTDQIVGVIRSEQLKGSLGVDESSKVVVFKPTPLGVKVEIVNKEVKLARKDLEKVSSYMVSNYEVREIGESRVDKKNEDGWVELGGGLLVGGVVGLFITLIKQYFKNY